MAKRGVLALAIVVAVSVVALVAVNTGATGSKSARPGAGDSDGSFLHDLHSMAYRWHHGGGGHGSGGGEDFRKHMSQVMEELDLSPEQTQRLEALHRTLLSLGNATGGSMADFHDELIGRYRRGDLEASAVRDMIDRRLEEIRAVAYAATDDTLAMVNSLDSRQRDELLRALEGEDHDTGSRVERKAF